jgi:hypothetical protein
LGEAGARLLSRDGRAIAHFDQPCHRLVVSDHGDRALALAPRGAAMRIAKLDFATRRAISWCETRLNACAFSYDGALWFLTSEGSIFAVDTTSQKFGALWHTPEVGDVACIERTTHSCAFITRFTTRENFGFRLREKWERWLLEVPSLILRQRTPIANWGRIVEADTQHEKTINAVACDGVWASLTGGNSAPVILTSQNALPATLENLEAPAFRPYSLHGSMQWWVCLVKHDTGFEGSLLDRHARRERLCLSLRESQYAQVRFGENHLTICDDRGRLLAVDLEHGAIIKNFRLT